MALRMVDTFKTEHEVPLLVTRVPAFGAHGKATGEIDQAVERAEIINQFPCRLGIGEIDRMTIRKALVAGNIQTNNTSALGFSDCTYSSAQPAQCTSYYNCAIFQWFHFLTPKLL